MSDAIEWLSVTHKDKNLPAQLAWWSYAWPTIALALTAAVNLVWIGVLAYGLAKLL